MLCYFLLYGKVYQLYIYMYPLFVKFFVGVGKVLENRYFKMGMLLLLLLLLSCFSCVWLCATPLDGSPPGSPVPGILQARTLEWVSISFSNAWKWKVKVKLFSRVWLFETPWTAAYQALPSMEFSRQEYWSGLPLPSPKMGIVKKINQMKTLSFTGSQN